MTLTDEQTTAVTRWVEAGDSLSDIQKKLREELSVNCTYMETRFLVDDLRLTLKSDPDPEPEPTPEPTEAQPSTATDLPPEALPVDEIAPPTGASGNVRVTLDQIARPDAIISGKVTFSDGEAAGWYLDQMGRLGLDADTPGYRPSETDVIAFQNELQSLARTQGF
ncbi:MAG: hypothetical protein WA771_01530 [Chthoniobacterales bacterium]